MQENVELSNFFNDLKLFIQKMLEKPELIENNEYIQKSKELRKRGRILLSNFEEKNELNWLIKEAEILFNNIKNDATIQKLINDTKTFTKNAILNSEGKFRYNIFLYIKIYFFSLSITKETLEEMKKIMIPIMLENFKNISLPKIEGTIRKYDYIINNIVFSSSDILPDHADIKVKANFHVHLKQIEKKDYPDYSIVMKM